MTFLLICAVTLRIISLDDRGLTGEEVVTLCLVNGHATGPFGEAINNPSVPDHFVRKDLRDRKTYANVVDVTVGANGNSVLYHIVLSWWTKAFGNTNFSLRFVSLLFGAFTVILGYYFARQLFNERVAVISAAILCLHPLMLEYSQTARAYMPAAFFILSSTYSLYQVSVAKRHNWLHIPLYTIVSVAAMLTHYMVVYILIAHLILLVFFHGQKKAFLQYGIMGVSVIALFVLWWFNGGAEASHNYIEQLNLQSRSASDMFSNSSLPVNVWINIIELFGLHTGKGNTMWLRYIVLLVPLTAIFFALLRIRKSEYFRPMIFVVAPLLAIILLMPLTSFMLTDNWNFEPEYFSFAIPFAVIIVAFGIDRLLQMGRTFRWIGYGLTSIIAVIMCYSAYSFFDAKQHRNYAGDPFAYHKAAAFIENKTSPADTLVFQNKKDALFTNIYLHRSFENAQSIDSTMAPRLVVVRNGKVVNEFKVDSTY